MFFNPLWLALLAPWTAAAVWIFRGRLPRVGVPFLFLWPAAAGRARRRGWERPPVWALILLAAALLGIIGAAGPYFSMSQQQPIVAVIDRGAGMSATDAGAATRFFEAGRTLGLEFHSVVTRVVPSGDSLPPNDGYSPDLSPLPRTAMDTSADIIKAEQAALAETDSGVVVLSDQAIAASPRAARLGPTSQPLNAGIASLSVADQPIAGKVEVMVRVASDMPLHDADISVASDQFSARQSVRIPTGESDYFLTLDGAGPIVQADLSGTDDWEANHTAWAVRQGNWPRVEIRGDLPPALRLVVDLYAVHHPPTNSSPIAGVASSDMSDAGLIWTRGDQPVGADEIQLTDPKLTGDVDWNEALADVRAAAVLPATEGWTPVVSRGGVVLIAEREKPTPQVWVGFWSDDWTRRAGFVVFCTRALDYLAGGGATYTSSPIHQLSKDWTAEKSIPATVGTATSVPGLWPGVYRNGANRVAINAGALQSGLVMTAADGTRLADLRQWEESQGKLGRRLPLAGDVLTVAAFAVAGALGLLAFENRRKDVDERRRSHAESGVP